MKYLGIDLGGTNVAAAVVDEEGAVLGKVSLPTPRGVEAVACAGAEEAERSAAAASGGADAERQRDANGTASLGGLAIIELKQDTTAPSPMKEILARLRIKPFKISKYCIGEALTNPHVKRNRFKAKLRAIDKMSRNANKNITL